MSWNLGMDAEDEGGGDFRADLLAVDGDLHMDDINILKFLCRDIAPTNKLDKVNTGHELFYFLENAGYLSEQKKMMLAEMLKLIQRLDLVDMLKVDEHQLDLYLARYGSNFSQFRLLLLKLSDDIGDDDLHKLLFCSLNVPKAKREKIKTALDYFTLLEQSKKINAENVDFIEDSMRQVGRNDLAQYVTDYKQSLLTFHSVTYTAMGPITERLPNKKPTPSGIQVEYPTAAAPEFDPKLREPRPVAQSGFNQSLDLVIPEPLIHDIVLNMTDSQFTTLGFQLGRSISALQNIFQRFTKPTERNFSLIKEWLLENQQLERNETILKLSEALKNSGMADIGIHLQEMFGLATPVVSGLDISIRQNRSQLTPSEQQHDQQQDARIDARMGDVINQFDRIDVDEDPVQYYKMDAKPRGLCLIINNRDFYQDANDPHSKAMPQREGTNVDADKLKATFEKLEFLVYPYENLTDTDMAQLACKTSLLDHGAYDCFVCCILSHGAQGKIYGSNGRLLDITEITGPFKSQSCPTLAGKPKLFFIQACQGREKQTGHEMQTDSEQVEVDAPPRDVIPNEADFLFGYATVAGFVSYRSKTHGSWYITKLTEVLNKYAKKSHILDLLLLVNHEVSRANANMDGGQFKQSPAPLYTLRKKLLFR